LTEYRKRSILLGREVIVMAGNGEKLAEALAIDDDCGLVVRHKDGTTEVLNSGVVSIRVRNSDDKCGRV
jgi:BirA family biotin operon repressor/biotin-[acetyl-CoA-carboxylase] ligase